MRRFLLMLCLSGLFVSSASAHEITGKPRSRIQPVRVAFYAETTYGLLFGSGSLNLEVLFLDHLAVRIAYGGSWNVTDIACASGGYDADTEGVGFLLHLMPWGTPGLEFVLGVTQDSYHDRYDNHYVDWFPAGALSLRFPRMDWFGVPVLFRAGFGKMFKAGWGLLASLGVIL